MANNVLEMEGVTQQNGCDLALGSEAVKEQKEKKEKSAPAAVAKKAPAPIRRERLDPEQIAEIITREADRIKFRDVKAVIEKRTVKVFSREEEREVINIGDNVIIYGLYHKVTDNDGTFRDVFYEVQPINNLAAAYIKDMNPKGILVAHPRRAARLAIMVETYCRLFIGLAASPDVALSVSAGLDGPENKKATPFSRITRAIGFV